MTFMIIENTYYTVDIARKNGTIIRIFDRKRGFILDNNELNVGSFRLQVLSDNVDKNFVLGKEQSLTSTEKIQNGIVLHWDGPLKNQNGKRIDVDVIMKIIFEGQGLEFQLSLNNRSPYQIIEVQYPFIGGLLNFGGHEGDDLELIAPRSEDLWRVELNKFFKNYYFEYPACMEPRGWWPTKTYLVMPFIDIYNSKLDQGIYLGTHDTVMRTRVINIERLEKKGIAANIVGTLVHFPYLKPGKLFKGSTFVLQFHEKDWKEAGKTYRNWFISNLTLNNPKKDWMRQSSAIQYLMFLLPEGNIKYTFKDIPKVAREAKDCGTNLMISGWQHGGHDNGYPWYEPDPRLGTYDDLEAGIKACHKMGAKVCFFANIHPITLAGKGYQELKKYLWTNMEGTSGEASPCGFGMGTLGARMGLTTRRMVWASVGFPEFRKLLVSQFSKLAAIGADGIHLDKCVGPPLDFNPGLDVSPDVAGTGCTIQCIEEIYNACRKINPDFCLTWEGAQDRNLSFGDITWWVGGQPPMKWIFPEWAGSLPVQTLHDFGSVNIAFKDGHQLLIAFEYYTRSMGYKPYKLLAKYVKEINKIREELKNTIFLGRYLENNQVYLKKPNVDYSVFQNMETGKRACILVNDNDRSIEQSIISFEGNRNGRVQIYRPFEETICAKLPVTFTVNWEHIAVIVED